MEDILPKNNHIYMEKIERVIRVAMIIDEGVVREESLTREYDEALHLYRKQKPRREVARMELQAWQQDLMRIIQ